MVTLGWIAMVFALIGSWLVSNRREPDTTAGFGFFSVANILWMAVAFDAGMTSLLAMNALFLITSIRGMR